MCIPFTGIAQFPDVAHNLEILQDQEDCDESERSGKKQDGSDNHRNNNQDSGNNDKFLLNFSLQPLDSQQSRVFPESCTLLFMPNVVVDRLGECRMLPEIVQARQTWPLQQDGKKDMRQYLLSMAAEKELPGISSIRDVEYDIEFASGAKPIAEAPYRISPVMLFQQQELYGFRRKLWLSTKWDKISESESEDAVFWGDRATTRYSVCGIVSVRFHISQLSYAVITILVRKEVDIIKKAGKEEKNQAKMTKLSMEWKTVAKIKAKMSKCPSQVRSILKNQQSNGAGM
ncbi:hypothetical protein Tco_0111084 [Tanacetum coccineum]